MIKICLARYLKKSCQMATDLVKITRPHQHLAIPPYSTIECHNSIPGGTPHPHSITAVPYTVMASKIASIY